MHGDMVNLEYANGIDVSAPTRLQLHVPVRQSSAGAIRLDSVCLHARPDCTKWGSDHPRYVHTDRRERGAVDETCIEAYSRQISCPLQSREGTAEGSKLTRLQSSKG